MNVGWPGDFAGVNDFQVRELGLERALPRVEIVEGAVESQRARGGVFRNWHLGNCLENNGKDGSESTSCCRSGCAWKSDRCSALLHQPRDGLDGEFVAVAAQPGDHAIRHL
ncbi:hypothetical protein D3C87_1479190 [compost metagenome]